MKLFTLVLPLIALFTAVSAFPTASPQEDSLQKRQADPSAIITDLIGTVKQYTAVINSTAAGVSTSSPQSDQEAAGKTITAQIANINTAVVDATNSVKSSAASSSIDANALAGEAAELIEEISGTLNNVINSLGLTATLSFLGPLVSSLSALLLALEVVVNDLLALVQAILDNLLTGLSLALAGLTL